MSDTFCVKSASLQARGEIGPEDGIEVQFSGPVDRKSAQTGFSLAPDLRGNIAFEEDDTVARQTPVGTMSEGEYTPHLEEIAEFDADPGRTYTAKIREWSGSGGSWYGLAWTVH